MTAWFEELSVEAVAGVGALAAFLTFLAIAVQVGARRLARELQEVEAELVDAKTGLLPQAALRVRLGAELAWAATSRTPISVAVLRIRGSRFVHAAHVLRHSMREEEQAFVLRDQHVVVELWGADPERAVAALLRIGDDLARAGHPVVDAGVASAPADGSDVDTLVLAARRDMRPLDDLLDRDRAGSPPAGLRGQLRMLASIAPWFAGMAIVLLAGWRLLPPAIEASIEGAMSSSDLLVALVAAIGIPLGAAFVHSAGWNIGSLTVPRSRPYERAGAVATISVGLLIALPLSWGVFAPELPTGAAVGFGATLALLALLVVTLVHARQLVYVGIPTVAALLAIGAAVTWLGVDTWQEPIVANAGRLVAAAAAGALLARCIERSSWIVGLAVVVAGIDLWSIYAESGVTNQLLDPAEGATSRVVDVMLFAGPAVNGSPLFELGVTDLVFVALFLAWAADWRVDVRAAAGVLIAGTWAAFITADVTGEAVPALPFLSGAIVLLVVVRSLRLRGRVGRWRADEERPRGL